MSIGVVASQAFSPNKLSDLILWLDASDLATIIESGGNVSQWNDKSSNANNVVQTFGSKQPVTGVDTINGINALTFDGDDDFLQRTTFTGGQINQPNTIFLAWELPVLLGVTARMIDGSAARHIIDVSSTDRWRMWAGNFLDGSPRDANTPYYTSSIFNIANTEGYINGVLDITGAAGTNNLNGITIAAQNTGTSSFLNVKMGEIIIYDRLIPTAERLEMENYLSNKWRI